MKAILASLAAVFAPTVLADPGETRLQAFQPKNGVVKEALAASARSLVDRGYEPSEFFVEVEVAVGSVEVTLIHEGDLASEAPGSGNGKSQVCEYLIKQQKLLRCLYFQ